MNQPKYKTGLTLSGGAARGMGHVAVLQVMEEEDVKPDILSGTSAGALIAVLYASGLKPLEIKDLLIDQNFFKHLKLNFFHQGIFKAVQLYEKLYEVIKPRKLEELEIPVIISATNFHNGQEHIFEEGDILQIVQAASAVPILFEPVKINGTSYVDGGLVSNMPVEPLLPLCEQLIGVNVNPIDEEGDLNSLREVVERTLDIAMWGNVRDKTDHCDLFIEPAPLKHYSVYHTGKMAEMYDDCYAAVKEEYADELKQLKG